MEFPVPVSNGYLYWHVVGEMGENAKSQDGDPRMLSIIQSNKLSNDITVKGFTGVVGGLHHCNM